jgi:hypothetical protein
MFAALQAGKSLLAAGGLAATAFLPLCSPPGGGNPPPPAPLTCGVDAPRLEAYGLTADGELVCVDAKQPDRERSFGMIEGLDGEALVGIDVRGPFVDAMGVSNGVPAAGTIYGLGAAGGVYSVDTSDGNAVATKRTQLNQALSGTSFGVDFNPTVDRLRIVSDTGQNLRANVDTGETIVDGALNTLGTPTSGIVAAGYTNNDTDPATGTTLYVLDAATDQLTLQSPPNAGGLSPVGALGVDASSNAGFDIYSEVARSGSLSTTQDLTAWAALEVGGVVGLYDLTPFSGRARLAGAFDVPVIDLAFPLEQ